MTKSAFADLALRLLLAFIILYAGSCGSSVTLEPGAAAPDFSLPAVRGGSFQLADHLGEAVLLSFINTQAEASSATADPSRAQIVFLKSMQEQYGPKGLVVLIVDAARIETGSHPGQDQLINFTFDWQLEDMPVLDDTDGSVARSYGIQSTPTTLLIGTDAIIQQRWDGFASASQLALSIKALVGAPNHRQAETAESPATFPMATCPDEALPQAKFAGVGLARALSDELWVVDGGQPWGVGTAFPVQWLLLDTQNRTQQMPLHIEVIGQYTDAQKIFPLSDQPMEILPADVSSGLLSGDVASTTIYSLVTTVLLEQPGCLKIWATVTGEGSTTPRYQGSLVIPSR